MTLPIVFRNHQTIKTLLLLEKKSALPRYPCCHLLSFLPIVNLRSLLSSSAGNKRLFLQPADCSVCLLISCDNVDSKSRKGGLGYVNFGICMSWLSDTRAEAKSFPTHTLATTFPLFNPTDPWKVELYNMHTALKKWSWKTIKLSIAIPNKWGGEPVLGSIQAPDWKWFFRDNQNFSICKGSQFTNAHFKGRLGGSVS